MSSMALMYLASVLKNRCGSGQPSTVTLNNPPKGEYKVICGIICGPHHDDMEAKLVVE